MDDFYLFNFSRLGCKVHQVAPLNMLLMWEVVASKLSAKYLSQKFCKIHREVPVLESLSNIVTDFQTVRLTLYSRETPVLVFQNQTFVDAQQIGVLEKFTKLTEKQLSWSLFLIKLQALRPANLLKKDSNTGFLL